MRRWFLSCAAAMVIAAPLSVGCEQPGSPPPDTAATGGSTNGSGGEPVKAENKGTDSGTAENKATEAPKTDTAVPDAPKAGDDVAVLDTGKGKIVVMFYPSKAPKSVENFKKLAASGFYAGTRFHRCIPGFMVQGGDPNSKDLAKSTQWGMGGNTKDGKEVNVPAEFTDLKHTRGVLSMARSSDPNSASSQFFIMVKDTPSLDGQYSAFGKVVKGLEVADEIVKTGDAANNGAVEPKSAIILKSVKMAKWPVD